MADSACLQTPIQILNLLITHTTPGTRHLLRITFRRICVACGKKGYTRRSACDYNYVIREICDPNFAGIVLGCIETDFRNQIRWNDESVIGMMKALDKI